MAGKGLESEADMDELHDSDFVQMMKRKLPPTVVNCLLATGKLGCESMQGTNDRGTHGTDRLYMHALRDSYR